MLQLPARWSRPAAPLPFDEEIYVLDGDLEIGGVTYPDNAYGFLAAGTDANALRAPTEVVLLYFRSGHVAEHLKAPDAVARRTVGKIDLAKESWDGEFAKLGLGALASGARMKILREDPFSGETTYISASIAYRIGVRAERHPIVQEFFLLSGELAGELGVMQAGAYCFRRPMFKHGPYGSPTGAVVFFRGLGGEAGNILGGRPAFLVPPGSHAGPARTAETVGRSVRSPAALLKLVEQAAITPFNGSPDCTGRGAWTERACAARSAAKAKTSCSCVTKRHGTPSPSSRSSSG